MRIREPKNIRLYSSNTNTIYPETEIKGVDDSVYTVENSGKTFIISSIGDDSSVTVSYYEYRKYSLVIPEDEQISLQYLQISLDFEGGNWLFVSEVEVYHGEYVYKLTTILDICLNLNRHKEIKHYKGHIYIGCPKFSCSLVIHDFHFLSFFYCS